MPIDIKFTDFDTVCYSNQHNIIELIRRAVGLSIEVNINAGNISGLSSKVNGISDKLDKVEGDAQEGHDAFLLATNLNQRMSSVETWTDAIRNDNIYFQSTPLGQRIADIERRLDALGIGG